MTTPEQQPDTAGAPPPSRPYDEVLADAVRVLTEAGRLTRPVLEQDAAASEAADRPVWVKSDRRETGDWAEFVTLALAGAAANLGGIETALAGRPGSWEADGVRNLLTSTVGHDEQQLLEHRTEPVVVEAFVGELMVDLGVWKAYDDAQAELVRRYDAIGIPTATTAEAAHDLEPATEEQERQAETVGELEDRLEQQRAADWTGYGQALSGNLQNAFLLRPGLRVPVIVRVDVENWPTDEAAQGRPCSGIAQELLSEAMEATPLPGDGRSPLERLEGA